MDKDYDFIGNLYFDPIKSLNLRKSHRRYRLKEEIKEEEEDKTASTDLIQSLPSVNQSVTLGSVIMQNWETKRQIPKDLPNEMMQYPVLIDRNKFQLKGKKLKPIETNNRYDNFTQNKIFEEGSKVALSTMPTKTTRSEIVARDIISNQLVTSSNVEEEKKQVALTESSVLNLPRKKKETAKKELIDFSTFNRHLYLRDNDFLYAKRVGGPVDFVLCTYQDINPRAKKSNLPQIMKGKKSAIQNKKLCEYITISKNTVTQSQNGILTIYSVQEWIDNYKKYKQLMNISLFKNFKNAKLFDLWKRFYQKSRRQYYTDKLTKRFFLIDEHLRAGIFGVRSVIEEIKANNIFEMNQIESLLLNKFKELHSETLKIVDYNIEAYRLRIKKIVAEACAKSYKAYKELKKITLDDNVSTDQSTSDTKKDKKNDEGANIQNFIKDAIPYAQDATRKTHYKKLLRYIRVIDYLFNEAKYQVINLSLGLLDKKFKRLYDAYIKKYIDAPLIITKILCMSGNIYYNPSMKLMSEAIFDNYIQETIYCVIYKKNFIDPSEFQQYMSVFEEVFEVSVDQNANLNTRIKESVPILDKFNSIRENFDKCHEELNKYAESLVPIYRTYLEYNKLNFKSLEESATPKQLKDLLEDFKNQEKIIKALRPFKNIGIFQFQLDDLLEMITEAPRQWLEKIKIVIPNVLIAKENALIEKLTEYLNELSDPVESVETFIKLKKIIEKCNKDKQNIEDESNDIIDLQQILENNKEIKLQEYDQKLSTELKSVTVNYERKLDGQSYFIDNNISSYRAKLKAEIDRFDQQIKGMITELNNETLNKYNEDTFEAIDFLEENSLKIQKCVREEEKYKQEEEDLEVDPLARSNFTNLRDLVYDQELKVKIWNSVREFQFKKSEWEKDQILRLNIPKMEELIKSWIELCDICINDLDVPGVPTELKTRLQAFQVLIPVFRACQNPNIHNVESLLNHLMDLLKTEMKLDDALFTTEKLMTMPHIYDKVNEIDELNTRANEEKRLKDLIKNIDDGFYSRKVPIKPNYDKKELEKEFEFVEENIKVLNKIYLEKYVKCIISELEKTSIDFTKYQTILMQYVLYEDYVIKSEGIMDSGEFAKEMPAEYKKLMSENLKRNLYKTVKDNPTVLKLLEHAYEKLLNTINSIIQNFEQNYKAIGIFLDKKRKEMPKYYLLSNDDLLELYQERESNEIKLKIILKLFPYITSIIIGDDQDENITYDTIDGEKVTIKYTKSTRSLKDLIDFLDSCLNKKIKECFKGFKKEYELSFKTKNGKKPKEIINELITNKDNLGQAIFNCMYYLMIDSLEKSLLIPDEAFDKLFDLYNDIKEERIIEFIEMLKKPETTFLQKRILSNIISLQNYSKIIIETLIREDVSTTTDYNFYRIINVKIENDSFILHFLNFTLEYGYDYVGIENNFMMIPDSERVYLVLARSIMVRRPFELYGIKESGKNETLKTFANLCGKRINFVNTTEHFSVQGFNNILYGNLKYGCWICLNNSENMKFDLLEILGNRILEVYRILIKATSGQEEFFQENGDKFPVKVKQMNIFLYRNLSYQNKFNPDEIPKNIKNYFRQIGVPCLDAKIYLLNALNNFAIDNAEEVANKIMYTISYANKKIEGTQRFNLPFILINKIIIELLSKINDIKPKNKYEIIRHMIKDLYQSLMNGNEYEEFRKFLNEVYEMKDYEGDLNPEYNIPDENISKAIKDELATFKFNNQNFEQRVYQIFSSLNHFDSFTFVGPPISGKTQLFLILSEITKKLHEIDASKYAKMLAVKIYPKAKTSEELFAGNKVLKAYKFNNNFFYNMIQLFQPDNKEILEKLNSFYYDSMSNIIKENENYILDFNQENKKEEEKVDEQDDISLEGENMIFTSNRNDNVIHENIMKAIIFDGQIDNGWIEYINNIYNDYKFLTTPIGDCLNLNDNFKMFFEVMNLKNVSPSFLTRQFIVHCDTSIFSWDNILYCWIDSNKKITENPDLKNYIRGLFENYIPKVVDFVQNNKFKNITFNENYIMKTLISIFDSIIPMFNFEDKRIGRKHFNVVPKIEIIKKCTLSIFIFSCAWTMNFLSNFIIRTKIEKYISDIFKADDLKGPIFDYYIDPETNDFELWSNLLKDDIYQCEFGKKGEIFQYGKLYINTIDTIPYTWLCEKFISMEVPFYFNGKPNTGKSALIISVLDRLSYQYLDIKKVKYLASYNTTPEQIENYLNSNLDMIKRDKFGDKFGKKTILFVDDVSMNLKKDEYGSSLVLEYLRGLSENKYLYDQKYNIFKYLDKFNLCCCGNVSSFPNDDNFNRFISGFIFMTQVQPDEPFTAIFKPTLEFCLRNYIPNTSGITATQYIQVLTKLINSLNENIINEPKKSHYLFNIRDAVRVIQAFHLFKFKGPSEFVEYLKKCFFYETSLVFEGKMNKEEDIKIFREKLCESYSSVFKQDKVTVNDIFNEKWGTQEGYIYARDYNNFNGDNEELLNEHVFIPNKKILNDYIREKVSNYYRTKDIKNKNLLKIIDNSIDYLIKILRVLENQDPNLILIGKENCGKNTLFNYAAYLSGIEVMYLESSYNNVSQEVFIQEIISPLLQKATIDNRRVVLFISSKITTPYIWDVINKLFDTREIPNNFIFIGPDDLGKVTEEESIIRLEKNLSFCIDLVPKSELYRNLFTYYPYIVKNAQTIYIDAWEKDEMISYFNESIEKLEIGDLKNKLPETFSSIFDYANKIYNEYSERIGMKMNLTQKHFCSMVEFYSQKYDNYKQILIERQKKYNDAIELLTKSQNLIDDLTKQIDEKTPEKQEIEKTIEEKKKLISTKQRDKGTWRVKRQDEEKIINNLDIQKKDKQAVFNDIIQPFKDLAQKALNQVNKISPGDLTEIKNTWDSLTFGKFILGKLYELYGDNNSDWDYIKKTLDIKIIKNFAQIDIVKNPDKILKITRDVTNHPDFTPGDKYQKPFRTCGILCDYFVTLKNYFDEIDRQKEILGEIERLTNEIGEHNAKSREYINNVTNLDKEITEIETEINKVLDVKRSNIGSLINKLDGLKSVFEDYISISSEKLKIWVSKKGDIDAILSGFDFYLMIISAFIFYGAPLNKTYRNKFKKYLYSLAPILGLNDLKEFPIYKIFIEVLDQTGKDSEFCSSIAQYNDFIADNFTMMYIMSDKIPYIIDYTRLSAKLISEFLELKNPKGIVVTKYNDVNEDGEMFDKLESAMKSGNILFIEQVEENIVNIMENYIYEKSIYNGQKGKFCYNIKGKLLEKHDKFKLYFVKSKITSKIHEKAWNDCFIINFNSPSNVVEREILRSLANEQDPITFQQISKIRNDISKDEFKILDTENKILNFSNQFDTSGNLEKLEHNQTLLDRFKVQIQMHTDLSKKSSNDKKRLNFDLNELDRYNLISKEGGKIYKWCFHFFDFDNIYMFTLDYFTTLIREYYKDKFGIYKDKVKKRKVQKMPEDDEEEEKEDKDDKEDKEEEEEEEEEEDEDSPKKKNEEEDVPTFEQENLMELIIFLYNKISNIYSSDKRKFLLLILLFYNMKQKEEIPTNYKDLIVLVDRIYFKKNIDREKYNQNSPIKFINDDQWNALKEINDKGSYIFAIIIDHMENHVTEWENYLNDDNYSLNNFIIFDEDVESSMNPLIRFLLFSILKPYMSDAIVTCVLNSIFKEDDPDNKYQISNESRSLSKQFVEDFSQTKKPLLFVELEKDDIIIEKEVKDYLLPHLKYNNEANSNNKETNKESSNEDISYKEIIPTKIELNANELDIIHTAMKNGGVVLIKNASILKDSLIKLMDEFDDPQTVISDKFKLIFVVKHDIPLRTFLYTKCVIINRDINILTQMKEYIIDLIDTTPIDQFNKFMNNPSTNNSAFFIKKLYIYFTIIHAVLIQYCLMKAGIFKIPIDYRRKDYYSILGFISNFINSLNDDKLKELSNNDNSYGFTYDSLIKIIVDMYINSRLIYHSDVARVNKIINAFFEDDQFLKDDFLFSFNEFLIPKIQPEEKEIITNQDDDGQNKKDNTQLIIPKDKVIEAFRNIPYEQYDSLLFGISQNILKLNAEKEIINFFDTIGRGLRGRKIPKKKRFQKLNMENIKKSLEEIKLSIPDPLSTQEGNPVLFKINKYNEFFNPLDAILQNEISEYNKYINDLEIKIDQIQKIFKGEMVCLDRHLEALYDLSNNNIPKKWCVHYNPDKNLSIEDWKVKIKKAFDDLNKWIEDSYLYEYDISLLHDIRLFLDTLPIYFQKKLPENVFATPDKIVLKFFLTRFQHYNEIDEETLNKIKETNHNQEILFIRGLKINGFESVNDDHDILFSESDFKKDGVKCPLIGVTYNIVEFKGEKVEEEEEEEEDEDEEEEGDEEVENEEQN